MARAPGLSYPRVPKIWRGKNLSVTITNRSTWTTSALNRSTRRIMRDESSFSMAVGLVGAEVRRKPACWLRGGPGERAAGRRGLADSGLAVAGADQLHQLYGPLWMRRARACHRRGYADCRGWMSTAVHKRLLDKRWTRKLIYAVSI